MLGLHPNGRRGYKTCIRFLSLDSGVIDERDTLFRKFRR